MDPVTATIVVALAAGAAAAAKDVASSAIKDAYAGLRKLIVDRYARAVPFAEAVEEDPSSEPEQAVLAKQLEQAGASSDEGLKWAAETLLNALTELREDPRAAALFDFDKLQAAKTFQLKDIQAVGTVLRAREATFQGDFIAEGIRQKPNGGRGEKH